MHILGSGDTNIHYDASGVKSKNGAGKDKDFYIQGMDKVLTNNLLYAKNFQTANSSWYNKFNRYGWRNPYDTDIPSKEFLFFTKPDLNFYDNNYPSGSNSLQQGLRDSSYLCDVANRQPQVLATLQSSCFNSGGAYHTNFMNIFSNAVCSSLELPSIDAESHESTPNVMGTAIQYRGHSLKSDVGYDFSLSFYDTSYLEIYNIVKAYDEYERYLKLGLASPKRDYILNHIVSDQFSIFKFIVGSDGETILYYAKLTGCYFKDVPRNEFGELNTGQLKYALGFHAQFIEDNNPEILADFNRIVTPMVANTVTMRSKEESTYMPVFDENVTVDNSWANTPLVIKVYANEKSDYSKRIQRRGVAFDYYLKWISTDGPIINKYTKNNQISGNYITSDSSYLDSIKSWTNRVASSSTTGNVKSDNPWVQQINSTIKSWTSGGETPKVGSSVASNSINNRLFSGNAVNTALKYINNTK